MIFCEKILIYMNDDVEKIVSYPIRVTAPISRSPIITSYAYLPHKSKKVLLMNIKFYIFLEY